MTILPSLSLSQAARTCWDVLVVGAGPAGSVVSGLLARQGVRTLLVDQAAFPRDKVCGCCLNLRALDALNTAGLGESTSRLRGVPLSSLVLAAKGRSATLPLPGGLALSRQAFDAALIEAGRDRGADFLPSTRATLVPGEEAGLRRVRLRQPSAEGVVSARVVLAADGLGGTLLARAGGSPRTHPASRIGAGIVIDTEEAFYRPGVIFMSCGAEGYAGMVRLEDGRLDIACAVDARSARRLGGIGPLAAALVGGAGWPIPPGLAEAPWRGTPPLTRSMPCVAGHRLFALGDAAGYVEPFTGEGMAWALAAAIALAPLAQRAARSWREELMSAWQRQHRQIVTARQRVCRISAAVLRRPWLTAACVQLLSHFPRLALPILDLVNAPSEPPREPTLQGNRETP